MEKRKQRKTKENQEIQWEDDVAGRKKSSLEKYNGHNILVYMLFFIRPLFKTYFIAIIQLT
jgi:hypothetical protein